MLDHLSPLRYKVVVYRQVPQGDTTRDPEPESAPSFAVGTNIVVEVPSALDGPRQMTGRPQIVSSIRSATCRQ
jgi:hypothetical protein